MQAHGLFETTPSLATMAANPVDETACLCTSANTGAKFDDIRSKGGGLPGPALPFCQGARRTMAPRLPSAG
jgi:hypothetical protein